MQFIKTVPVQIIVGKGVKMSNQCRKSLEKVAIKLEDLNNELSVLLGKEYDHYENMPKNFNEICDKSKNAIDCLDSAFDDIDSAISGIYDAIGKERPI